MTQYLADRKFSLSQAPLNLRVLITLFSGIMVVALCIGAVNYWDKTGLTPAGIVTHYLGNEGQTLTPGQDMAFSKSFAELLDATHPHLFGQGVLLFILCHIVALTGLSERTKISLYSVGFGAMILDAAMPWLVRYASPALAPLQLVSTFTLLGSLLALIVVTLRDLWFSPAAAAASVRVSRQSVWPEKSGPSTPDARASRPRPAREGRERQRGRREGGSVRPEGARADAARGEARHAEARATDDGAGRGATAPSPNGGAPGAPRAPRERPDGERRRRLRGGRRRGPRRPGEESPAGESPAPPAVTASTGAEG